jgi:hypothetical protein
MRYALAWILFVAWTIPAWAQPPKNRFVGEVFIVGNTATRDAVIRQAVPLIPGQVLREEDIQKAEKNLIELDCFAVDLDRGVRPTVTVLDSPSEFHDILILVEELPLEVRRRQLVIQVAIGLGAGIACLGAAWFILQRWTRSRSPWASR